MSGGGVKEISSHMSERFRPQVTGRGCTLGCGDGLYVLFSGYLLGSRIALTLTRAAIRGVITVTDTMPGSPTSSPDVKTQALRAAGALHPHPEAVRDEAFLRHPFFDPRDRVQVKYEMVRCHRIDGRPVTEVAARFGVSRQAFYEAAAAFEAEGIPGLVPKRPGPKRAHKCTDAIVDYVEGWRAGQDVRAGEPLSTAVARRFGVMIHARSLDRAVARRKKNGTARRPRCPSAGRRPGVRAV